MRDELKHHFAYQLLKYGMFKIKTDFPDGNGFRLKLHETKPDAPLSPYYLNLRLLRSYPATAKLRAVKLFEAMIQGVMYDVLADVPTSITPIVSSLSDMIKIPMITPRGPKDHGASGSIDGVWQEGATVALFDDVVTEADSKLEAVRTLRANRLKIEHVFVLVDREQGGAVRLAAEKLTLHAGFSISELVEYYHDARYISTKIYHEIRDYQLNQ